MGESKSKARMIALLQTERKRLEQNLASLTPADMLKPGAVGEWSVKDVLAHLADWETHMPLWMTEARAGGRVAEVETGLKWKQFDEFNQRIYARHRDQSLDDVLVYFRETHRQFMEMVEAMPEDEMLERGRYAFTGKIAVVDWLNSFANHDLWAKTHIRRWKGNLK
jgi:uncharacterized protein (TIGR03083 family)